MDEAAVEAKGLDPIRARLAEVFATTSVAELVALAGRLFRADVCGLFYIYPAPDAGNPDRVLLYTGQGGLGLPDESYYREEKFAPMVQAYRRARAGPCSAWRTWPIPRARPAGWWRWRPRWRRTTGTT